MTKVEQDKDTYKSVGLFGFSDIYTSCYCEENIYFLADHAKKLGFFEDESNEENIFVAFISTPNKQTPLTCQKKASSPPFLVVWDYHVVLIVKSPVTHKWFVYDPDSRLPLPTTFENYCKNTFLLPQLRDFQIQRFRVIHAAQYLRLFASDRSHMIESSNGSEHVYSSPPPQMSAIRSSLSHEEISKLVKDSFSTPLATSYIENRDLSVNNIDLFWDVRELSKASPKNNRSSISPETKQKLLLQASNDGFGVVLPLRPFYELFA